MRTLAIGTLAYYDSMRSGLVPCKVTKITQDEHGRVTVTAKVTATRYAYDRGETIDGSATWIVPRSAVLRRKYGSTILPYEVQS